MSLHKILFNAGASLRNPSLRKHYRDLKNSESWSINKLKVLQEERLLSILKYAGENSPYYKSLFRSAGIIPGRENVFESLKKIPVTTKEILIAKNKEIHTGYSKEKIRVCETSGTSGQVLTFSRNESWDSFNRASIMRGYSWYGVDPWNFNIYFWGYNIRPGKKFKIRLMDFMVNRYRMFSYSEEAVRKLLKKSPKAVYIEGYSSMIYELAKACEGRAIDIPALKLIKGTSEKIYPHYSDETLKVFGKKVVSEYGAAESGIIAFECPSGNMHINMEGVVVEVNEQNEILVTNLYSYSFPVIRYNLGDVIQLKPDTFICPCGMSHPVIEEVTGRIGHTVFGFKSTYPSLVFYNIFKNLYFVHNIHLNYQAEQVKIGEIKLRIREIVNSDTQRLLLLECEKYFGSDIKIEIHDNADLVTRQGKLRDFISKIESAPL